MTAHLTFLYPRPEALHSGRNQRNLVIGADIDEGSQSVRKLSCTEV